MTKAQQNPDIIFFLVTEARLVQKGICKGSNALYIQHLQLLAQTTRTA